MLEDMGRAGGSARAEYERRQASDRAQIRGNLGQRIAVVAATPVLMFLAVRFGAPWALDSFYEAIVSQTDAGSGEPTASPTSMQVDAGMWTLAGAVTALAATVRVAQQLFGRRQTTEAWRKGSEGEVQTARLLDRLPRGFSVHHDLPMPRSRANIDHVVIGPTGVFTVETKSYKNGISIRSGRISAGGRHRDGIVAQAQRQAQAVSNRLGRHVHPIVVVHGGVDVGWFGSPVVDGVRFCSPGRLRKALTTSSTQMSDDEVADAGALLSPTSEGPIPPTVNPEALTPDAAPVPTCACGGTWVRRQRRSDGVPFLGCSAFPTCRRTRPIG